MAATDARSAAPCGEVAGTASVMRRQSEALEHRTSSVFDARNKHAATTRCIGTAPVRGADLHVRRTASQGCVMADVLSECGKGKGVGGNGTLRCCRCPLRLQVPLESDAGRAARLRSPRVEAEAAPRRLAGDGSLARTGVDTGTGSLLRACKCAERSHFSAFRLYLMLK